MFSANPRARTAVLVIAALLLLTGSLLLLPLDPSSEAAVGNFIPPARGYVTLCAVDETTFTVKIATEDDYFNALGTTLAENATDDGALVLSMCDKQMKKELDNRFKIGDTIYIEYPFTPDVVSDAGQITCASIAAKATAPSE